MRITFVLPQLDRSGGNRVVATHAEHLHRRGHQVTVVAPPMRPPGWRQRVKTLARQGRWLSHAPRWPSHVDGLPLPVQVLDRYRPVQDGDVPDADIVIATWWETAEWVSRLSPRKGVPCYFIQHHECFEGQPWPRVQATYRLPLHPLTISRWLVDLLREVYGREAVALIPNSVDMAQFDAPPRARQAIPTVGLLYAAAPFKGLSTSLEALRQVKACLPSLRVKAFGEIEPVDSLPLPEGTEYLRCPAQALIPRIYAACDVWLCGSRSEGFHLPPLEAMACRCPVVSTWVGGPADIIRQGVNGFLVDVGDSEALAKRLRWVLELPDPAWRRLSEAAYATARSYTWEDAADRFEAALKAALDAGPLSMARAAAG